MGRSILVGIESPAYYHGDSGIISACSKVVGILLFAPLSGLPGDDRGKFCSAYWNYHLPRLPFSFHETDAKHLGFDRARSCSCLVYCQISIQLVIFDIYWG